MVVHGRATSPNRSQCLFVASLCRTYCTSAAPVNAKFLSFRIGSPLAHRSLLWNSCWECLPFAVFCRGSVSVAFFLIHPRIATVYRRSTTVVASGHTATNTPDLFRTPKLTVAGPGQYWGGGPPGKPFGCCWLFMYAVDKIILCHAWPSTHAPQAPSSVHMWANFVQVILSHGNWGLMAAPPRQGKFWGIRFVRQRVEKT